MIEHVTNYVIGAVVAFLVVSALIGVGVSDYFNAVYAVKNGNSNVSSWFSTLLLIAPIGFAIGLLYAFLRMKHS